MNIALIACFKQEEIYIKDWLDWHISIGVDHFYLCDNNDKDYHPKLKDVIQEYINKGIVEIFDYSGVHPIQPICYQDIYDNFGNIYDWYLVIDIDEYVYIPKYNNNLKQYLETVPDNINQIGINWRLYDDNNLIKYDDRPLNERFQTPAKKKYGSYKILIEGQSDLIKSIIRGKQYFKSSNLKITHHHCLLKDLDIIEEGYCYDVLFNKIPNLKFNIKHVPLISKELKVKYYNDIYNTCYIRHYQFKTIEEYIWKINRGDTLIAKNGPGYPYPLNRFWDANEKTEEKLDFIKNYYVTQEGVEPSPN